MKKNLFILFFIPLLSSCIFRDDEFVDFDALDSARTLPFKVLSQHETDLSDGFPDNCYLPDGTPINADIAAQPSYVAGEQSPRRTTSIPFSVLAQDLLKYGNQNRVIEIVGTYTSTDNDGWPVTLSGKVMLPQKGRPKRMIIVSHYTVCSNREVPSNCFSLEGVLVKLGYGLIIPDYMGYGVSSDKVHPYLVMDLTARNVFDMYLAVKPWLEAVGRKPEYDDIYLMGYSQGGATTMAVEHLIETEYCYPEFDDYTQIHRVFAGGGPYDVKATYERFVNTDTASYPVAVPLVLQGMIMGNHLDIKMSDMLQDWISDNIDDWINSKNYTSSQINALIGTYVTHEMLTEEAMNQKSDKVAELFKAMTMNSIVSYNWLPQANVYIMHSMDDETVPYTNAANAKSKWKDANIIYNCGHYGGHVQTCLRFIYSVQTLLRNEEKERKQYEEE